MVPIQKHNIKRVWRNNMANNALFSIHMDPGPFGILRNMRWMEILGLVFWRKSTVYGEFFVYSLRSDRPVAITVKRFNCVR